MPFQSEKQRKYLWANEPEIARDWTEKYGSRVKKQDGGYTGTWIPGYTKPINLDPYIYPKDHAQKFDTRKEWATSPQMYHNEIMNDYVTNVSKNLSEIPYVGNVLAAGAELGAPIASGILSLPYELKQSFDDFEKTLAANPEKYNSLGSTALGILQAIDDQNPLSTVYHRTKGALRPIGRRLKNTWDAIKSEFGGSAEAEEMTIEELRDYFEGLSPEDIGLPKRGEADWEKYMRGQIADVPRLSNEEYLAQRGNNLYAGSTGNISGVQWKDDEEEPYDFTERLMRRGDFRPSSSYPSYPQYSKWKQFLSNVTRQPYRAATTGTGGYTAAQLNRMNALGGYYSEPARQQRRLDARRTNILNRAAKGKPVGNVNKLLGKYGYSGTPGSGTLQFTGQHEGSSTAGAGYSRSDDSWSSSPFRRGGLASLWQR